jgi:hypothetical protein
VIAYAAMLDVPRELVWYVSRLLAGERRARGTRKRARVLTCFRQALFALVWFRKREDLTVLGAGFGISRATAYRYRDEAVAVLAAEALELTDALNRVYEEGWSHVILDGKIVDTDRCRAKTTNRKGEQIDLWYSGKRHGFGGNIQAVIRPDGFPIWVGDVEPGSIHDLTCAQEHALGALYAFAARGLPTLADPGYYQGAGIGVHTPTSSPPTGAAWTSTTAPTTCSYVPCAASANAASRCWSDAGEYYSTSPPARRRSGQSRKPHSCSPILSTDIYLVEITSLVRGPSTWHGLDRRSACFLATP